MMIIEDKRRELFEAGINIRTRARNEHGDYVLAEVRDRWDGFNAALDAVVIELPSSFPSHMGSDRHDAQAKRVAELEVLLRKCRIYLGGLIGIEIDAALAGQQQQGEPLFEAQPDGSTLPVDPTDTGNESIKQKQADAADEREAFEAWSKVQYLSADRNDSLGAFARDLRKAAFEGWQAHAALAQPAVASVPTFPTMLRKMWSGGEVQTWLGRNVKTVSLRLLERIATPCMGADAEHLREGDIAELRAILGAKP